MQQVAGSSDGKDAYTHYLPRICRHCAQDFVPSREWQGFCTEDCRLDYWKCVRDDAKTLAHEGIAAASRCRKEVLELARDIAKRVALSRFTRTCSADDVYEELCLRGLQDQLGPAAGAIFKTKDWRFDRFIESTRLTNKGRIIRRWRYVGK